MMLQNHLFWYYLIWVGYVKRKEKNNKLMSFHLDDDKLLEKYKSISIMIENLKNIELNALTVYDDM